MIAGSLEIEIKILEKIRNAQCLHLAELVWAPKGIMPLGVPIRPPESPIISRKIIQGMIEGLRYLHGQHIIHGEIRLSNLIPQRSGNDINVTTVTLFDYQGRSLSFTFVLPRVDFHWDSPTRGDCMTNAVPTQGTHVETKTNMLLNNS